MDLSSSSRRTIHELRASAPAPGLGSDLPPAGSRWRDDGDEQRHGGEDDDE